MNRFGRSDLARTAAVLAATGFAGIVLFQLALAAGVPWGHAAWGGADAHLSTAERIGSAVAAVVWAAAALVVLGRAGVWVAHGPAALYRRATWLLVGVTGMSAVLNLASQSRWENLVLGPLSVILAILCTVVARSPVGGAEQGSGEPEPTRRRSDPAAMSR